MNEVKPTNTSQSSSENSLLKSRQKKRDNNHNGGKDFGTGSSTKQSYFNDSRTSSNNPIPKSALLMQNGSEYEMFVPEIRINNLRTKEGLQNLTVLYDTESQINMIYP
ncbi:hypothetical protein H8356DRAFT_1075483 [Neocallimastix lanati (nom. inval.)]|nr:hypothetical protein H8356DRAFT_1075483 [Neocallimastix sp. JGI-2020a]